MKPHKNLEAWKQSFQFTIDIYRISKGFPSEEKFGITSQLRRAAVSVPCNIAEGAARKTAKEFTRFLRIAAGSISELDTLLMLSFELKYISEELFNQLNEKLERISKLTHGLINKLELQQVN